MSRQLLRWAGGFAAVAIVAAGLGGLAVALGQCAGGGCQVAEQRCGAGPCGGPGCLAAVRGPKGVQATTMPAFVNVKCPMMGGAIKPEKVKPELVREFKGEKVAFCCAGCVGPWDKLSANDKAAKLLAGKPFANVKCPIMGGAIQPEKVKPELVRQFEGEKVGFCCSGCIPAWEKLSANDKAAKLDAARPKPKKSAEQIFANTKCPIMGRTIDLAKVQPQFIREFQGKKVAFCCGGCIPTWEALTDAEKAQKLVEAK